MTKNKKAPLTGAVIKRSLTGSMVGIAASLLLSLGGAKLLSTADNPLAVADTLAAICVTGGAFTGGLVGSAREKTFMGGVFSGGFYLLALLFASLWVKNPDGSPLLLLGGAVLGTVLGAFLGKGSPTKGRKRLKKLVKR